MSGVRVCCRQQDAVNPISAELIKVSRTRYFTVTLVNSRQKTSADGICLSLHATSIFSLLLLLLLSANLLSAEFADRSELSA